MAYPEQFSMTADQIGFIAGTVLTAPEGTLITKIVSSSSTATLYPATPVVLQADGTVDRATASNNAIYGFVKYNEVKTVYTKEDGLTVITNGARAEFKAGAAIAAGQKLEISLSGAGEQDRVVPATTGTVIGVAENAAAENERVGILVAIVNV
jgi:hypothetical protein